MGKYKNNPNKGFINLTLRVPDKYDKKNINNIRLNELKESTGFKNPYDVDERIDVIFNPQKTNRSRKNESRNSKSSKSNYILTHKPNGSVESQKQGWFILAADKNMAFYDWDMVYRRYYSNAENEQEKNRFARRTKKEKKEILQKEQREYDVDKIAPEDQIKLYQKILDKVLEKENFTDWLYGESHIGITEENKDRYMRIVGFEPADGEIYTDINDKWKENKDEEAILKKAYEEGRRFIDYKNEMKKAVNWVFDYEKCQRSFVEEFGQDLTEDEKNLITPEFCEKFIDGCIKQYWGQMKAAENNRAEGSGKNIRKVIEDYKKDSKKSIEVVIENLKQVAEKVIEDLESKMKKNGKTLQERVKRGVTDFECDVKKVDSYQKDQMKIILRNLNKNIKEIDLDLRTNVKKITYIIKDDTEQVIAIMRESKNCDNNVVDFLEKYEEKLIEKLEKEIKEISQNVEKVSDLIDNINENIDKIAEDKKVSTKLLKSDIGRLANSLKKYVTAVTSDLEESVKRLDEDRKEDRKRKIQEFPEFLERYHKLNLLHKQFNERANNHDELTRSYEELKEYLNSQSKNNKNKVLHWGTENDMLDEADEEKVVNTKEAIRKFFDYLGVNEELDEQNFDIVKTRIRWININVEPKRDIPIFLIGMVMNFGPNFMPNKKLRNKIDDLFKPCDFYKMHIKYKTISYVKLRYELIRLLDKFHDSYELNMDERVHSWNDFFYYKEIDILSSDEVAFWREYLGDKYDRLPAIGFQLYFVDCVESCMPIDRERLQAYKKTDCAIKEYIDCVKNIKEVHDEESREITEIIDKCKRIYVEDIGIIDFTEMFQKIWSDLSYDSFSYYIFLEPLVEIFSNCSIIRELPNKRCKVLELEVIFRTYQNRRAKNKMYESFKKIYGYSLDHVVDAVKHSAKWQAIHYEC